jgi:peptidoglycan/xylan/chitin deacetylase (PgdA/CDA1 family)
MSSWTPEHSAALLQRRVLGVNFHAIAAENRADVTDRLRLAAKIGTSLDPESPDDPEGPDGRPRIFVAFYDGYRETGLFGAELCADLGIRAYFFPIFSSADPERAQLTEVDLAQIATVHELCFHSTSHVAAEQVTPETVAREVGEPVELIRSITGHAPRISAWRGGTRFDEQTLGDRTIRELGVRFQVSNWSIERIPGAEL